jgi:hypothetical protein
VKETLVAVGEDPAQFGTHSLRSGGATAIAKEYQEEIGCLDCKGDGSRTSLGICTLKTP